MNWKKIPILECSQPIIKVTGEKLITKSAYYQQGYKNALPEIWLRKDPAQRLEKAASMLPDDITLILLDGWRPIELQTELYEKYRMQLQEKGFKGTQLDKETLKYVSLPSKNPEHPSPHSTGGSIDLTLGDLSGNPLNMGGEFDELTNKSKTTYYEKNNLTTEEKTYRSRRRLLCAVMTHIGFSNYPEEWWHFDMGNQFHHERVGGVARFGYHEPENKLS